VSDGKLDQQALGKFCHERLRECAPRRILLVKEVPRNEMGKIDRAGLQRMAKQAFARKAAESRAQPPA